MRAPGRGPAATSPAPWAAQAVACDQAAWARLAAAILLLVTAVTAGVAWGQFDTPTELKTIESVRFEGRHHVPRKDLDAVLKTRNPSLWPWRQPVLLRLDFVRADTSALEQVCWQRGYLDAVVNARLDPGKHRQGIAVTYIVHEGPRYYVGGVKLTGLGPVPEPPLRRHLYARPGRPYNPFYLFADTASIADACRQRGFLPHVYGLAERRRLQQDAHAPAQRDVADPQHRAPMSYS